MGVLCNDDERKKINNDCNKKQIESSNNNKNSINKYSNHNSSTNDVININFINNKSSSNNSSRSFNSKKSPIFKDNNLNTNSINFYRDKQNRNNNADDILEQLRGEGDIKTRSITASINKNEQNEINYNFIEKNIELNYLMEKKLDVGNVILILFAYLKQIIGILFWFIRLKIQSQDIHVFMP